MAQQDIDVGLIAGDGSGDPLREAFTKINENFTELYSGNVQVTGANVLVYSVAGRTGNVVLTVNDVAQAASRSYVDTAIAANLANVTTTITNSLRANITAANAVIDDHTSRIVTLETNSAAQSLAISTLDSTKATITYVDQSIDLALSSNAILADVVAVNANVTAANTAIQTNASNINTLFSNAATQSLLIDSINSDIFAVNLSIGILQSNAVSQENSLAMLRANINAANAAISAISVASLNANIAAANLAITSLQANAATQTLELETLTSNAGIQATAINFLNANAATQAVSINSTNANIGSYQIFANSNAASQSTSINLLNANLTAANLGIAILTTNAAVQALELNNLQSNAQAQQGNIIALQSNSAFQSTQIDLLNANVTAANVNVTALSSNATIQATQINLLNANLSSANINIAALTTNAAAQALDLDNLYANVNFYLANVASSDANIAAANARIIIIDANLGSATTNITALQSNATIQAVQIDLINSNVAAANINITSKADLDGAIFSGNVQAEYLLANANVKISSTVEVGEPGPIDYPGLAGVFVGNVDSYYQVVIQNLNNGTQASGDFVITADDGTDTNQYLNIGLNSSGFTGNFIVPAGDTGLTEFAHDGYFTVIGGNAVLRSDNSIFFVANTSAAGLIKDGDFFITSGLTVQENISADSISADSLNIQGNIEANNISLLGQIDYTMGNAIHWNPAVSNVAAAIDQIAARLYALENL
jgi:hypothetical protein